MKFSIIIQPPRVVCSNQCQQHFGACRGEATYTSEKDGLAIGIDDAGA
jgi:hypothetical protein